RADRVLVVGDPPGREAGLEERLDAVVLWWVHPDEHRPAELEREPRGDRRDPAALGRERLPVAADGVDVVGAGDRPVPVLLRELGDAARPVHRALLPQLLEERVWRAVLPDLPLDDERAVQVGVDRRHRGPPVGEAAIIPTGWLASQQAFQVGRSRGFSGSPSRAIRTSTTSSTATSARTSSPTSRTERACFCSSPTRRPAACCSPSTPRAAGCVRSR